MRRFFLSTRMVTREMLRNRVAMALLFLVPTILYGLIYATTDEHPIIFELRAHGANPLESSERNLSLLFMGSTTICGLMAFLSFVITWRPIQTDRRLVLEGYRPWELFGAKALVVSGAAASVSLYATALLLLWYHPPHIAGVFLGLFLGGLIYGLVGIVIGVLSRNDLGGILIILLLVNIDPGWLQNPIFYGHARNRLLIAWLPGHHPCQVTMLSALTGDSLVPELLQCGMWILAIVAIAAILYRFRIGTRRLQS